MSIMRIEREHPAVVLAGTLVGSLLAVVLLAAMMGGGFLLALLVLAALPLVAGGMALANLLHGQTAPTPMAAAAPSPPPPARPTTPVARHAPVLAFHPGGPVAGEQYGSSRGLGERELGTGLTDGEHPLVLVGSLLVGFVLAGMLLLAMTGGGFLLALLVLVVAMTGALGVQIASAFRKPALGERVAVPPSPAPIAGRVASPATKDIAAVFYGRPAVWGLAGAVALAAFSLGTMTLLHNVAHTLEDIRNDFFFFLPLLVGFGVLVGLWAATRRKDTLMWGSSLLAVAGTGAGILALMNCCVGTLAALWQAPALTSLTIALVTYKVPIVWAGIAAMVLGLLPLGRGAVQAGAAPVRVSGRR
ncbi:MAG: hypothetical protein HY689_11235 [Chloroflexi bacterium]|nr:hypothetical protein [Chloroflexota bacterium]